jgi:hypothetical protein
LKTANPQGFVGSNPTPSATSEQNCERQGYPALRQPRR